MEAIGRVPVRRLEIWISTPSKPIGRDNGWSNAMITTTTTAGSNNAINTAYEIKELASARPYTMDVRRARRMGLSFVSDGITLLTREHCCCFASPQSNEPSELRSHP